MVFWPPASCLAPHHSVFLRTFVIFPLSVTGAAAPVRGTDLPRGEGVAALTNPSCHRASHWPSSSLGALTAEANKLPGCESVAGDVSRGPRLCEETLMGPDKSCSRVTALLSKISLPVAASQLSAGKFQSPQNRGSQRGNPPPPDNNRRMSY